MGEHPVDLLVVAAAFSFLGVACMAVAALGRRKEAIIKAILEPYVPPTLPERSPWTPQVPAFGPVHAAATASDLQAISTYLGLDTSGIREAGFVPLGFPATADWRAGPGRWESHQDFAAYTRGCRQESFHWPRLVVLRSVGAWPVQYRRFMPALLRFTAIFFQRPVRWGCPLSLDLATATGLRETAAGSVRPQYMARSILRSLGRAMPVNAVATVGVTLADLHTENRWDFVAGQALLRRGVGICSLSLLFGEPTGLAFSPEQIVCGLERSLKILAHELGHVFGLEHCVLYRCGMNGCASLAELDRNPLPFCPACQAKLAWNLGWNVGRRYREFVEFFSIWKMPHLILWYREQACRAAAAPLATTKAVPVALCPTRCACRTPRNVRGLCFSM